MTARRPPPPFEARTFAALLAGRAALTASRRLRRGGTSLPGLVAASLDPAIVSKIASQLGQGSVVVTGTNGKTTTSRMIAEICRAAGFAVVHNRSGSNLLRGLAATAVAASDLLGRISESQRAMGVFEVDEATLPLAIPQLKPRAIVFTNLLRDQLDRYGEVDSIATLWRKALKALPAETVVVLNADDPSVAELGRDRCGATTYFGIDDPTQASPAEHAADSRWCAGCGSEYEYSTLYFGHAGVWRCPGCGNERPHRDVSGTAIELRPNGSQIAVEAGPERFSLDVPVGGLYNVYNALAAVAGSQAMGLPVEAQRRGIEQVDAAFGRQETLEVAGRKVQILLCKNPAGANQVLRFIQGTAQTLLILLNDGIADGRDISWIWDVDFELLAGSATQIVVSGTRATDLALRLKYAGLDDRLTVEPDEDAALNRALAAVPAGGFLSVLPTYTAMLSIRDRLARRASRPRFWQD